MFQIQKNVYYDPKEVRDKEETASEETISENKFTGIARVDSLEIKEEKKGENLIEEDRKESKEEPNISSQH